MSNPNAPIIHGLVFAGNSEATNLGIEQLPNDPAYRKGRIWFNTTEEKLVQSTLLGLVFSYDTWSDWTPVDMVTIKKDKDGNIIP